MKGIFRYMQLLTAGIGVAATPISAWDWDSWGCGLELDIDFSAEVLCWNTCQSDDLFIGVSDTTLTSGGTTQITNGHTEILTFDYEPGFRLNGVYYLPFSDWALVASYTYFRADHARTLDAVSGGTIWAGTFPRTPGLATGSASEAKAKAIVKYDLLDLLIANVASRGPYTNTYYFGLRSVIFEEQFNVGYIFNEVGAGALQPGTSHWTVYMPAIGITAGCDGVYDVWPNWGIRARIGASALGASAKHHQHWTFASFSTQTSTFTVFQGNNNTRHSQVIWGWDAALGLEYDFCWCCQPVTLSFGYEVFDWWNTPRQRYYPNILYPGVSTTDETGRFTIHGLYVRLGASF